MALTAKHREELAARIDVAATWLSHSGRAGELRSIAAELRGEEHDETPRDNNSGHPHLSDEERIKAAEEAEQEAQEVRAARRAAKPKS
jgi:hypothetical protein